MGIGADKKTISSNKSMKKIAELFFEQCELEQLTQGEVRSLLKCLESLVFENNYNSKFSLNENTL